MVPAAPVNGARFFHHTPQTNDPQYEVSSHNALCRVMENFAQADQFNLQPGGYQDVLRTDAFKFIVVITDDDPSTSGANGCPSMWGFSDGNDDMAATTMATDFDTALTGLSPQHFGTPSDRNYIFHSIIGIAPYNSSGAGDYGDPYPPAEPLTGSTCSPGAEDAGRGYQALSVLTGGARYPSCGLDYTEMFQLMAQGVIAGAQVSCEFEVPDPPMGETLDLDTVVVDYTSNDVAIDTFTQVGSPGDCAPDSFYIEAGTLILCPDACTLVQTDPEAQIEIRYGCEVDEEGNPVPK